MKIRNKLYFNAGMSIILVVILFSVMLMASRKISEKNKEREIARNLQVAISELGIITYEYLMHHEKPKGHYSVGFYKYLKINTNLSVKLS